MKRRLLLLALLLAIPVPVRAQHALAPGAGYDPAVPTPQSVIGHEVGARFTPHHALHRYFEKVAESSPRVRLDTLGYTFEGREVLLAVVTSEANQRRLDEIRATALRLADPRTVSEGELQQAVGRTPAVVWLGHTVHGNEASGTEAAIALLYQLAAGSDAETRAILDSTVVLIDPLQNPDGHERHVQDVMRRQSALGVPTSPAAMIHSGSWPGARTSHYLFDLNRDWFLHSHPETRARIAGFLSWMPHVAADLHEMGSNSTYFFAPPMEPVNANVDESIKRWWDIYAAGNAAAFDANGWSYFRREGYDEFYPGYGVSWPILHGAVGMTYEQASSRGGAIRRNDGTVLTLEEAARQHYTAAFATALTTARRRTDRVRDFLEFRRSAITQSERNPLRAVVLEPSAQGRADSLVAVLLSNGIEVRRTSRPATVRATAYGSERAGDVRLEAGSWIVDLAQPAGRLARALLEPDARLEPEFIAEELESRRTGQSDRFYDVTAWSLPYTFRVRAWGAGGVPASEPVSMTRSAMESPRAGADIELGGGPLGAAAGTPRDPAGAAAPALPQARYAYAFAPGSESSLRLLSALLADSVRVWYAPRAFRSGEASFPNGAFVVRVAANPADVHARVARGAASASADVAAIASAMVDEGTDLGSNSVTPLRPPRVALVGGTPVSAYSHGFAWFALDQRLRYPATTIETSALPGALDEFDVVVLPSAGGSLDRELGESGHEALGRWVRSGGVLVTLDGATGWLTGEKGLSRFKMRRDTVRADGEPGAPLPASVPGAIVRAVADTLSPLMAGVNQAELPVLVFSGSIYQAPRDVRPGEVVLRYAPEDRLRLAGYLWPEVPARLAGTPYLWTERVGSGRVIAFAGDPNFRDMWRGLLPLFANSIFLGGSF